MSVGIGLRKLKLTFYYGGGKLVWGGGAKKNSMKVSYNVALGGGMSVGKIL